MCMKTQLSGLFFRSTQVFASGTKSRLRFGYSVLSVTTIMTKYILVDEFSVDWEHTRLMKAISSVHFLIFSLFKWIIITEYFKWRDCWECSLFNNCGILWLVVHLTRLVTGSILRMLTWFDILVCSHLKWHTNTFSAAIKCRDHVTLLKG